LTDLLFDDPCLLFALSREARPFLQEFRPQERFPGAPCRARFCGPSWLTVLVLETGVGRQQTEAALNWLLSRPLHGNVAYRPKVVLSAGYCGALDAARKVGDVCLATEVADLEGNVWPTSWPGELPPGEWSPQLYRGRVLTTPQLIGSPEEKRALASRHAAIAVDMESAIVARLCRKHDIPFGCVRAVSDEVNTALSPRLVSLLSGNRISALRTLTTLATAPGMGYELWQLSQQTKKAAEQLGKALGELLTLTLPFDVS